MMVFGIRSDPPCPDCHSDGICSMNCGPTPSHPKCGHCGLYILGEHCVRCGPLMTLVAVSPITEQSNGETEQ